MGTGGGAKRNIPVQEPVIAKARTRGAAAKAQSSPKGKAPAKGPAQKGGKAASTMSGESAEIQKLRQQLAATQLDNQRLREAQPTSSKSNQRDGMIPVHCNQDMNACD